MPIQSKGGISLASPMRTTMTTGNTDSNKAQSASTCNSTNGGGLQLSPNVCIERGHRRHTKRDGGVLIAPGRSAKFTRFGGHSARTRLHNPPSMGYYPVVYSGGVKLERKVKW
jgi:hypothetical protein